MPNDKDNIIYVAEDIYNTITGDHVWLAVVEKNINIDKLDYIIDSSPWDYEYNNINIKWAYKMVDSTACFEYNGYKYYVRLSVPTSEQAILDIVKEMF